MPELGQDAAGHVAAPGGRGAVVVEAPFALLHESATPELGRRGPDFVGTDAEPLRRMQLGLEVDRLRVPGQTKPAETLLRHWREQAGLTLGEVADLSGWSIAMVSRVERGERRPSPLAKVQLARRLGVRVRDLFDVEPVAEEVLAG
jgi:DNA-binding XRE family transcriptional regulator